ncbi:Rod shape-determining protein RodA [hydrothermal vent metagenome]|uniref:Rod shape-determining protein RodA n=1 Tax=hydrothermal vent metagenome TaxID=652676 RepID=A0A3B0RCL1_9ZZZZ
MIEKRYIAQTDWLLLGISMLLATIGIVCIYSATRGFESAFYVRQFYWLLIGLAILVPTVIIDYAIFKRFAYPLFGFTLILLIIALFGGHTMGGAQRWLSLGFVSFQPSELAKITFVITLAKVLSTTQSDRWGMSWRELALPALILFVPFMLVARQPDLGTAMIFVFVFTSMVLIVKIRLRTLIVLTVGVLAMIPTGWYVIKDYQRARLLSFIDPAMDPLGSGYQTLQSQIAIGSGGFIGKGFTKGTQGSLSFLPAHHTDFIFPLLAEEWGFIGGVAVIALFIILILRGLDIASNSKDRFGFLLAFGLSALLFWHVVINIGMVIGFLPVVGVPLPFLSYGGSFLLTVLVSIGLLLNISMRKYIF